MYDVACIGIIVADAIGGTVDHVPGKGKLELVDSIRLYSGGCAANAAIDLAKIGLNVCIIGKIGNDGFGSFLKNELVKHNIGIEGLVIGENEATSASFVLVDSEGERSFLHCLGANAAFSEEDIDYEVIKVIDTTGAGDSFAAGFITGKIKGWDLLFCGKFANAVGAQCVMDTGASTGIKSFDETLDFMKKYD